MPDTVKTAKDYAPSDEMKARAHIDADTGELTFVAAPDYENPGDLGTNNVYNVTVRADDQNGGTTQQAITVAVTPVNDNPIAVGDFATTTTGTPVGSPPYRIHSLSPGVPLVRATMRSKSPIAETASRVSRAVWDRSGRAMVGASSRCCRLRRPTGCCS